MKLDDEIPNVTDGKGLTEIINKSLAVLPRNEVLLGIKTKQAMGVSGYDSALGEMFKQRKPRQNLLRKAYVTHFYRKELSVGALKEIADRMRHSIGVAMGSYRKVGISALEGKHAEIAPERPKPATLPIIEPRAPATLPIVPPRVPTAAVMEPPKPYFVPRVYAAEYREAHKDEIMRKKMEYYREDKHKILRAKILGNLNNGVVKQPTARSVLKYGLWQDPASGKWYSSQG